MAESKIEYAMIRATTTGRVSIECKSDVTATKPLEIVVHIPGIAIDVSFPDLPGWSADPEDRE